MYYTIEHVQGTPYVFWENSVCFSRPGFNDTQEVRLSPTFPECCTFCLTRCASAQGTGATRTTPPPEPRTLTIRGLGKDQIQLLQQVSWCHSTAQHTRDICKNEWFQLNYGQPGWQNSKLLSSNWMLYMFHWNYCFRRGKGGCWEWGRSSWNKGEGLQQFTSWQQHQQQQ